jgi:hypothetical protein
MIKKILPVFLLITILCVGFFACKKVTQSSLDPTRNYFPLNLGHPIYYQVDSIYYLPNGYQEETICTLMYVLTDTFTNNIGLTSYILNVYYEPYNGAGFQQFVNLNNARVIYVTPTANSLLYTQDGTEYIKLMFPIQNGYTWQGNQYANVSDSIYSYLANWNYTYKNYHMAFYNDRVNFDNTVTVLENQDSTLNYLNVDPQVDGYYTFAEEVYAYNIGMVYKEWTHYTWTGTDSNKIKNGYSVTMRAVNY